MEKASWLNLTVKSSIFRVGIALGGGFGGFQYMTTGSLLGLGAILKKVVSNKDPGYMKQGQSLIHAPRFFMTILEALYFFPSPWFGACKQSTR